MMEKADEYRRTLLGLAEWEPYLMAQSGLPGPRGNLELAEVAASLGDLDRFRRYVAATADEAPENTPLAYLVVVGVWGLGWQIAHGGAARLEEIRPFASDPRWRVREATAIALQAIGDAGPDLFRTATQEWSLGNRLEQRAAVAAVAEPRLLRDGAMAAAALELLDRVTASMIDASDSGSQASRVLRQALGYAWSVVVVAAPEEGKARFEALMERPDPDVRWIVRENLGKKRLERMDSAWVAVRRQQIARGA